MGERMRHIDRMVRAGSSQPMKIVGLSDGIAKCVMIDSRGFIQRRFHPVDDLVPMWLSFQPKSLWPEITQADILAVDREEQAAAAEKSEKQRLAKRGKRSYRIKKIR